MPEPADAMVGPYKLLGPIGSGANKVYRAHNPELNRLVAVKARPMDEKRRARLLMEARIVAKLRQPHVVETHDVWDAPTSGACLVMELPQWCDLRAPIDSGRIRSLREILRAALEIAGAIVRELWDPMVASRYRSLL